MAPTDLLLKPPEQLLGIVDEGRYFALAADYAEQIPDLIWPASVMVYGAMRNDPALAAVLSAYSLPIRRATWVVDPAGCRDEVARTVADDLGLPVLGDDVPGAARVRGVSWSEHLRAALLYLVYGHAAFEMLADTSSGRARLVGLYERTQHTISYIHTGPNGDFGGVSQFYHPDRLESPEIPADRMVFYSHAREGSAFQGRSLLRSCYAPWLLKREAQRVLATSSRRFGMGVPTVEWAAGVTPSPQQMTAAQEAASAARVGDQAGLSMPPGSTLVLKGLSGGTPDTLGFIKWLDQQISKSALAQFLDLGQTETGSRALGDSFLDLFTLSLAAIAEELADTVTRQAAARVVAWNWGLDEPVPAVVVSDIGTKHEFTAEALQSLMQAGAITADPALEAYVRDAYQLPERATPWVSPAALKATQPANPVAAAASTGRRPRQPRTARPTDAGQLELPLAAAAGDEPTSDEADAQRHQQSWEQAKAQLLGNWPATAQPMVDDLSDQAAEASKSGDLTKLAEIAVSAAVLAALADALTPSFVSLAAAAAALVSADAKAHGVSVRAPKDPGGVRAAQVAQVTANLIATGYAQAATRKAMQVAGGTADEVRTAVNSTLTDMGTSAAGLAGDQVGAGLTAAQTAGRLAVFNAAAGKKIVGWRSVEHNDQNACQPCKDENGFTYSTLAEVEAAYPISGYIGCLGGTRCRGYARAIWK